MNEVLEKIRQERLEAYETAKKAVYEKILKEFGDALKDGSRCVTSAFVIVAYQEPEWRLITEDLVEFAPYRPTLEEEFSNFLSTKGIEYKNRTDKKVVLSYSFTVAENPSENNQ